MSGLSLWASRLLFALQLLWLLVQAAPAQPVALDPVLLTSIAPGPTEPWPLDQQIPAMNSFMAEDFESLLKNSESSALPADVPEEIKAFPTPQEPPAHQSEDPEAGEHSSTQEDTSAQSAVSPEVDQSVEVSAGIFGQHPTSSENVDISVQEKSSVLPQLPVAGVEPPSVQPKAPAPTPKSSLNHEVSPSPLDSGELQNPELPYLHITNADVGVLITPRHPTKTKPSETEETSALKLTKKLKLPIQLGVPPKAPEKTELSSFQQEALAHSASKGDAVRLQQTPPQHPQENNLHSVLTGVEEPTNTDVTVPPVNLELTLTPEPTVEAEHHSNLKKTTAAPKQPEVTFPHPEPVQAEQPTFSDVTVPPLDLELTLTPEPTVEAEHPTRPQQTAAPAKQAEVAFPHVGPVHTQQTTFSDVRVPPLKLKLTVTPEPAAEAEHPRALQQSTAPPQHPLVTFLIQEQQPTSTEGTGHGADLELIRSQQPETSESAAPVNEENAIMSICELCTCKNETLSCTGLSPKHRLHRVPVLNPKTHNGSFTILNFKGNSISYINRDTWESYQWAEKLILSENHLRELHKDSFEGLRSLQYLDLSSNQIQLIERNTFQSMPFLQHVNLHNNLITNVRFGTFQAWHGMQFLHNVILSHNPLTTVEDLFLFKLPALRYLDVGRTQVSLTTVESILLMALKLRKLILPSHLACCLCQFKSSIEAVSKTVELHCASDCLTHTQCDEERYSGNTEGSLMKVLQGRAKHKSPELTIEPERASPGKEKGSGSSAFMDLLMKLLAEQGKVKVSKADWDTDHWGQEGTEAQGEEEEQESRELRVQVPGYGYKNKLLVAAPVVAVATIFMVIFCLMAICHRRTAEEGKEGRAFSSSLGHKSRSPEHDMEEGSFQRRWPLRLWDMCSPLNAMHKGNVDQNLHHSMSEEAEPLDRMEKGEASM